MLGDGSEIVVDLLGGRSIKRSEVDQETLNLLVDHGLLVQGDQLVLPETQLLKQEAIQKRLSAQTKEWMNKLEITPCTSSTNTDLLERASNESIDGHILAAEVQLAGRGRRGRGWVSPFGHNIMVSLGAVIDQPPMRIGSISLAIGVGLARAIEAVGVPDAKLKWPNDVLIEGKKVAGILVEMVYATQPVSLVIGMGINVHAAPGEEITGSYLATKLSDHTSGIDRNVVLVHVLDEIARSIAEFDANPRKSFGEEWEKRDFLVGKQIAVTETDDEFDGLAQGIDSSGAYLVKTETGVKRVIGGTVRVME